MESKTVSRPLFSVHVEAPALLSPILRYLLKHAIRTSARDIVTCAEEYFHEINSHRIEFNTLSDEAFLVQMDLQRANSDPVPPPNEARESRYITVLNAFSEESIRLTPIDMLDFAEHYFTAAADGDTALHEYLDNASRKKRQDMDTIRSQVV
jgi:hypothetical protein